VTTTAVLTRTARFRPGRALRLEIKHSAVVWVLPVLAALFYVDAYRKAAGYPPIWTVRASALGEANVIFFSVIAAGLAAWAATRESRRKTGDLLATTARAPWARQATVLAATAFWNVFAYLTASATAFSLADTARYSVAAGGWEIPALHDAADDQPVPYSLDCTGSTFRVCIHPAFEPYLNAMNAALQPAAAEIAGLPGAPARAEMTTGAAPPAIAGTTSVYAYSTRYQDYDGEASWWATPTLARTTDWVQGMQEEFITWFVSGPSDQNEPAPTPAQEAVAIALLAKVGAPVPPYPQFTQPTTQSSGSSMSSTSGGSPAQPQPQASAAQITAAARGLESLSPTARHAWLAANFAALRSGTVTLAQVP
jgi:hypothetical protein